MVLACALQAVRVEKNAEVAETGLQVKIITHAACTSDFFWLLRARGASFVEVITASANSHICVVIIIDAFDTLIFISALKTILIERGANRANTCLGVPIKGASCAVCTRLALKAA